MCGLFGFITKAGTGPELGRLRRIAAETEQRGRHAFGLAWVGVDGRLRTFKRPGAATDRLLDLEACGTALAAIGHCRWATHGDPKDNRNNHPHPAGRGWVVHNGVVRNHAALTERYRLPTKTECDSEVLGLLIARHAGALELRAARTAALADGPLALLGLWVNPVRLLMARRGRPLLFGETRDGFYFGSLPGGLPGQIKPLYDHIACTLTFHRDNLHLTRCAIPQDDGLPLVL